MPTFEVHGIHLFNTFRSLSVIIRPIATFPLPMQHVYRLPLEIYVTVHHILVVWSVLVNYRQAGLHGLEASNLIVGSHCKKRKV